MGRFEDPGRERPAETPSAPGSQLIQGLLVLTDRCQLLMRDPPRDGRPGPSSQNQAPYTLQPRAVTTHANDMGTG